MNTDRFVSLRQLAVEFGKDRRELRKWLLRHDFSLHRKLPLRDGRSGTERYVTVLTATEVARARFIRRHGVIIQEVPR